MDIKYHKFLLKAQFQFLIFIGFRVFILYRYQIFKNQKILNESIVTF